MDNAEQDLANKSADGMAGKAIASFRVEDYSHYLHGLDLSDAQIAATLQTLWEIIAGFVDLGFGVDSVQRILPAISAAGADDSAGASLPDEGAPPACAAFKTVVNKQ